MAQLTFYIDNSLEVKVKEAAKKSGVSLSKFIAKVLEQKIQDAWSEEVKSLSGSWGDFPSIEEIRGEARDTQRECL